MKLNYTPGFYESLDWFIDYYRDIFPEGRSNGRQSFSAAIENLKSDRVGERAFDHTRRLYELPLTKTPFSLIYRVEKTGIDVLHLRDRRGCVTERWIKQQGEL